MLVYPILWSSLYGENICNECENCSEECNYYNNGDLDYDLLDEIINNDFDEKFGENEYEYFVICDSYKNNYGLHQNFVGHYSPLYSSVKEIIDNFISGNGIEGYRIYKGKYNHVIIERVHHDGNEYYLLCRLNDVGQSHYDKGYDIAYPKYAIKGTFKDFGFFNEK